jgi:hypothetical protein
MPASALPTSGPVEPTLREQAEACTGGIVRERRILEIECRYLGADRRVRVGEPGMTIGTVVEAIFQLGRDTFTIHHSHAQEPAQTPVVLRQKDVYSVTEFD